jgi:hypothetical protein
VQWGRRGAGWDDIKVFETDGVLCVNRLDLLISCINSSKGENSESTFLFDAVRFSKELNCVECAKALPRCRSGKSNMWKKINI